MRLATTPNLLCDQEILSPVKGPMVLPAVLVHGGVKTEKRKKQETKKERKKERGKGEGEKNKVKKQKKEAGKSEPIHR